MPEERYKASAPDGHEHSDWWRKAIAEAESRAVSEGVLVVSLDPATTEDRTCSRCHTRVPENEWFATFDVPAGDVLIVGGLCETCLRMEGIEPPPESN